MNRSVSLNGEVTTAIEVSSTTGRYSDQSFTLLMNQDPEVKPSEMSGLANDLNAFEARMLGRAHDLEGEFDDAATEFTEIIKWDISTLNAEDLATWMEATSSIRFCAAITEEWSDYVKEYKQERLRIINRWNEEAPGLAEGLDEDPPSFSFMWEASPAEEAEAALTALKTELQGQEETAYSTLDTRGDELSSDLSNGPTPESVQRLIDGGYITWSYFNLGGDVEAMPIDVDPEEMAEDLTEYLDDPEGYEGDISEIIVLLNNMGIVAMDKQNNGGTLTGEELDFLTDFYEALEAAGGENHYPPGVLSIADRISENLEIGEGIKGDLLGALGDGILVLSDESILGGYDKLPESVRDATVGPTNDHTAGHDAWLAKLGALSLMMDNANSELRGGEQFSVNLTQSVAHELDTLAPGGYGLFSSEEMEALIDVSSRNEEAMHAILTGGGQYEHPEHGLDPEMTLRGLYTFNWEDEGEAVSGVTDWMWEQADGEWHEQERAGEAMAAFVDLFGDPAFNDAISGTGYSVDGQVVGPDGTVIDTQWNNVSAGHLNPQLAWAWSDLFSTYIDDFASGYGAEVAGTGVPEGQGNTQWHSDHGLQMTPADRLEFIQQIMGDGNAASRVYTETMAFGEEKVQNFVEDRGSISTFGAEEAGILRGLVDSALDEEAEVRVKKNDDDVNYQNKVVGYSMDVLGAAIAEVPFYGSGLVAEGIKIGGKEAFNVESYPAELQVKGNRNDWEINQSFKLAAIREIAHNDPSVLEKLEGIPYSPVVTEGGKTYIPADPGRWDLEGGAESEAIRNSWREIMQDNWGESEFNSAEAIKEYVDAYNEGRGRMNESELAIPDNEKSPQDY